MFLNNRRFFKKRKKICSFFSFEKKAIYLSLVKIRLFFFKLVFKKLLKLSKRLKVLVFFCFKKNIILSKKSKNSRMGKGKGSNSYSVSSIKNKFLNLKNLSDCRYLKLKKRFNFFLKKKIKVC